MTGQRRLGTILPARGLRRAANSVLHYFGYGSNMNLASLRAKGVVPRASEVATLRGWRLAFDVHHWFRHEGGVGNIVRGGPSDRVMGLVHLLEDGHLPLLDAVESYGVGYDRIEVDLETAGGSVRATTYVGLPGYLDPSCRPTRRYLAIIIKGAVAAGLPEAYVEAIGSMPTHPEPDYPPFEAPDAGAEFISEATLRAAPKWTGLAGHVFDMAPARPKLHCLFELFGARDTTLFHLHRHDSSRGDETMEDFRGGRVDSRGRAYINAYLHEYAREFRWVGPLRMG